MERPPDERPPEHPRARPPEHPLDKDEDPRQTDLLSIGLLVFFVSLIGVVGALLLVPVLF